MLRPGIGIAAVIVILAFGSASVAPAETNINFFLGAKSLNSDDWDPGNGQAEGGIMTTFGSEEWPVQIAIDLVTSGSTEESFRVSTPGLDIRGEDLAQGTYELDFGVRKIWQKGKARPFVGGGIAVIWAIQERLIPFNLPPLGFPFPPAVAVISDDDQGAGGWIDGGIFWRLTRRFNLGLETRFSAAQVNLFGRDVDAGGFHFGLILGFGF